MRKPAYSVAVATLLSGCALYLDWDPEGLPCDDKKKCSEDYSCLVDHCVGDDSLAKGSTCTDTVQCAGSLVCGITPFYCRQSCNDFFKGGTCEIREYCRPEQREGASVWTGTCFPSECRTNGDCDDGRACVRVTSSANACLFLCEPRVGAGGYTDNCGSTVADPEYCQPVGIDQVPVCLDQVGPPQQVANVCSPVSNVTASACAPGLACTGGNPGLCTPFCDPSVTPPCPDAPDSAKVCCQYKTPADLGNFDWAVCQGTCL